MSAVVTDAPLDRAVLEAFVDHAAAGATVCFVGAVRDHDHGRAVTRLEYEAHPQAEHVLREVAEEIAAAYPLLAIAVAHRVGPLTIGEAALVAAVSAPHRGEAFAGASALVDLVKERIPVWKHQHFADGTDEWVNCA